MERDISLIAEAARSNLAAVNVTITLLVSGVARKLERRAAAPSSRSRTLAKAGIPVGVSLASHVPIITDDLCCWPQRAQGLGRVLPNRAPTMGGNSTIQRLA